MPRFHAEQNVIRPLCTVWQEPRCARTTLRTPDAINAGAVFRGLPDELARQMLASGRGISVFRNGVHCLVHQSAVALAVSTSLSLLFTPVVRK